jgi:hypothetical protein
MARALKVKTHVPKGLGKILEYSQKNIDSVVLGSSV